MTRYKQAEFEDEDSSSIGSVALNSEGISTSATHIRYHTVSFPISSKFIQRSRLEVKLKVGINPIFRII